MADESFPLPGSSYKQLEKIITSYAELTGETGPAEVAQLAGTDSTNVSRNNKFLVETGIVEGKQKKQITGLGRELARAITFDRPEEQSEVWGKIIDSSEFLQKIVSAVRIRRGMDSPTLVNHIAFSAGGSKNAAVMAGAGAVLEILVRGGALTDQGGLLIAADRVARSISDAPLPSVKVSEVKVSAPQFYGGSYPLVTSNLFSSPIGASSAASSNIDTSLRINIQINCTPEEIEGLGQKLRKLIAELESEGKKRQEELPGNTGSSDTEGD